MPQQVEAIRKASAELDRQHTSMFTFRQPIPQAKIRKMKGLGPDDDIRPYIEYIEKLIFSDPLISKEMLRRKLSAYNPSSKRRK